MSTPVTAAIVTWNPRELLPDLIETLRRLGGSANIVISDNGSTDGSLKVLRRELPGTEFICNPRNGGFGYGNNRVLDRCETPYILLLNADARIDPESLADLVAVLEQDPQIAAVQPLLRLWDWPMITLSAGAAMTENFRGYDMDFMHFQPEPDRKARKVPMVSAALSLFRTDALKQAGGFDENIFMYFEDADLCIRLRNLGYEFLSIPSVEALHRVGASSIRSQADEWELCSSAYLAMKYSGRAGCSIPKVWLKREMRTLLGDMAKGRRWLWRIRALFRAASMCRRGSGNPMKVPGDVSRPRPMRMPRQRPPKEGIHGLPPQVEAGPGWRGACTGPWGFGCLHLNSAGTVKISLKAGPAGGSAGLWSSGGMMERRFFSPFSVMTLTARGLAAGDGIYIVPDRPIQELEILNVQYMEN